MRNLYASCTCATCLRFAYMFIAHVHSAHILHKSMAYYSAQLICKLLMQLFSLCFVYAFIARVHSALHTVYTHIVACNLNAGCIYAICMQFAYVLFMCILHICSMHINSTHAISEFTYVRSLQLCHAHARCSIIVKIYATYVLHISIFVRDIKYN